jgi:chromate reductase, NAD(P)H dehydrogenase (quinone)
MIQLLGISGSLRKGSLNTALLNAAASLIDGATLEVAALHGIPLYDGDLEAAEGLPPAVQALQARVRDCDGLILSTPEYNNGIPGVFKNAIDWLSRPPDQTRTVFGDRPVALIGASPGGFGTVLAQAAWLPVFKTLGMRHYSGGRVLLSRAHKAFDDHGQMTDEAAREQLAGFLRGFIEFVRA